MPEPTFLGTALGAAGRLADADLAAMLLAPFHLSAIQPEHAEPLVRLADTYGTGWVHDLVDRWPAAAPFGRTADHLTWTTSLARLCDALAAAEPVGLSIARTMARRSWRTLRGPFEQRRSLTPPSRAQEALLDLAGPVLGLLEAAWRTGDTGLRDEVTAFLTADAGDTDDLLACTMAILHDAPARDQAWRAAAGLDRLAQHCRTRLEARTGDVHRRIDDAEPPVRHQTRRRGSPYTLVLTKTDELFTREQDARRQDEANLAWLTASGMLT